MSGTISSTKTEIVSSDLIDLAQEATDFLKWHFWCKSVNQGYLVRGWDGILAIFYFEIQPDSTNVDDTLWVIVGDIPPAYIDPVSCSNGIMALEDYLYAMQEWVDAVKSGNPVDDLIPVYRRHSLLRVPATVEFAEMLESRLGFIREKIVSNYKQEMV